MGPVNWLAVVLAAVVAVAIGIAWDERLTRGARPTLGGPARTQRKIVLMGVIFLLAAIMMGHNFARIGAAVLDAKPWLYFMQTGGVALFFVIPAVWLTHARTGAEPMRRVLDCGFWLVAYLGMGVVFWALA